MKKFLILILVLFSLTSCFNSTEEQKTTSLKKKFENTNFSIMVPKSWEIVKDTKNILPKPSNWEIVFYSISNKKQDNFNRNLLVLSQNIEEKKLNSLDYIIWNYIASKNDYFYLKELWYKNVLIDSKKTRIYKFEARYSEDTPILKYLQTWIICDKKWYIITIALEKSNKNIDRYEGLLWSFSCSPHSVSPSKG